MIEPRAPTREIAEDSPRGRWIHKAGNGLLFQVLVIGLLVASLALGVWTITRTGAAPAIRTEQGEEIHVAVSRRMGELEGAIRLHSLIAVTPEPDRTRLFPMIYLALDETRRQTVERLMGPEWIRQQMLRAETPPRELPSQYTRPGQQYPTQIFPRAREAFP